MSAEYGAALDVFLKSDINQGPYNFTINYSEEKYIYFSKWGDYCSAGCAMTHMTTLSPMSPSHNEP
jgi:hypothetical protein